MTSRKHSVRRPATKLPHLQKKLRKQKSGSGKGAGRKSSARRPAERGRRNQR
jgi:hypothetical protein